MEKDPKQFTNLAKRPKYVKIVASLQEKLKKKLFEIRKNDIEISY